ncbi:MAG: hypothetical protein KJ947_07450 [Alphaproteobacteria bacterium]|nr:hypothetical protein [Alphaproteobacteria bacterium]MBU1549397.1 hypothetical protein [Alphaproteobacteria bacterium]MBU2338162.1 hypothetical protein [Alphaproteobacteria bacterium]MBU2387549.1 hypothetical protein [Alphaproteobacteria bacterium]
MEVEDESKYPVVRQRKARQLGNFWNEWLIDRRQERLFQCRLKALGNGS